jgi:hypothetical protein
MAEVETDVVDDRGSKAALGIMSVASAVLICPTATGAERDLATAVMMGCAEGVSLDAPRETASIAASWNRLVDVAIDAANASSLKRSRSTRRAMMAAALDRAGLILIEKDYLAAFFVRIQEQELQRAPVRCGYAACEAEQELGTERNSAGAECLDFMETDPGQPGVND